MKAKKIFRAFTHSCHAELVSASQETLKRFQGDVTRVRKGFTLAEVLITLMIIGVVAVLTIPAMMTNINDKALSRQRDLTSKKFTEGLRQMRVDGILNKKYTSTQDFVAEMKKYFKITSTCEQGNLSGCFSAETITGTYIDTKDSSKNKEEIYTVNNLTLATIAGKTGQKFDNYGDLMSITLQDGTNFLIAVNKDCTGPAEGETNDSSLTSCIAYIADVNNAKSPNKEGKDIYANIFLVKQPIQIIGGVHSPSEFCPGCVGGDDDFNAAAAAFCEKQGGRLPSNKELYDIAVAMGFDCPESSDGLVNCETTDELKPFGGLDPDIGSYVWASEYYDFESWSYQFRYFEWEGSFYHGYFGSPSTYGYSGAWDSNLSAICVK